MSTVSIMQTIEWCPRCREPMRLFRVNIDKKDIAWACYACVRCGTAYLCKEMCEEVAKGKAKLMEGEGSRIEKGS